jgi:hypothetical protein
MDRAILICSISSLEWRPHTDVREIDRLEHSLSIVVARKELIHAHNMTMDIILVPSSRCALQGNRWLTPDRDM